MLQILHYVGKFQGFKSGWTASAGWVRLVLVILTVPALVLAALSIALFVASLLALLLLTAPAYWVLSRAGYVGSGSAKRPPETQRGVRTVRATVLD